MLAPVSGAPLDPEKTAPFTLGPRDGPPCLLLHGFTGSPWEMRPLGAPLARAGYAVTGNRLPGHGTTPEALLSVTHRDWERACEEALLGCRRGPVRICGLSMGALLAVWLAARHPERVCALALLAPAVRFHSRAMAFAHVARRLPLMELLSPWVEKDGTDIEDAAVRAEAPVLERFPTVRLRDLWEVQRRSREGWSRVRARTLIAVAKGDRVVDAKGAQALRRGLKRAPVRYLEVGDGAHIMPRDHGGAQVAREVVAFFSE